MKQAAAAAAALGIALAGLTAVPAHADESSYLQHLTANGVDYNAWPWNGAGYIIQAGQVICGNLRYGGNPLGGIGNISAATQGQQLVDAAQHELCPETLH
jgi:hypothetical protein